MSSRAPMWPAGEKPATAVIDITTTTVIRTGSYLVSVFEYIDISRHGMIKYQ